MKLNEKLTVIYPLINPDDIAAKTLQSLIDQKLKHYYQDFRIQIFINNYKGNIESLVKKYKVFGHKKVKIKIYDKDYGQFKNLKHFFRFLN